MVDDWAFGTVLMYEGVSPISRLIELVEKIAKGLLSTKHFTPSHVAVLLTAEVLWEADWRGVDTREVDHYLNGPGRVFMGRPKFKLNRDAGIATLLSYYGRRYGYRDLIIHGLDGLLSAVSHRPVHFFTTLFNRDSELICSELVAQFYLKAAGYRFQDSGGVPLEPSEVRPDHIYSTIVFNPDEWELLSGEAWRTDRSKFYAE